MNKGKGKAKVANQERNPTAFIRENIQKFNYYEFTKSFLNIFKDQDNGIQILKKSLETIIKADSNTKACKRKAKAIQEKLEEITRDPRVDKLFQHKKFKVAAEKKAIEENMYTQKVGTGLFSEINNQTGGYGRDAGSDPEEEEEEEEEETESDQSEYQERESTPSIDVSQEIIVIKKPKVTKDYLISANITDTIELNNIKKKWILKNGSDFSTTFLKRRNKLVQDCTSCSTILRPDEELAINGIILLDDDLDSNMVRFDCYEDACEEVRESYMKYKDKDEKASNVDTFQFIQLMTEGNHTEAEKMLSSSSLPSHIKAVLYSLKQTYCKGYSIESVNENTAIKDGVLPFLANYFPNNKRYTTFGADKGILESKKRFTDVDPSLIENARKGDFSIVTNYSKHLVFALESKSERNKSRSKGDLIKMARYMKDTLDAIESGGFNNIAIAGMITSGVSCSCYIMEHKYDYIYTLYRQSSFYIPVNYHDMFRINSIFPVMNQLKNILQETIIELSTLEHERGNPSSFKKLKTYHTPTQLPDSRVKEVNLNTPATKQAKRRLQFK